jgi:protein required for attachment to host cells
MKAWIVVADSASARLYEALALGRPWRVVAELQNPAAHAKPEELVTDRYGRVEERGESPKDHETERLAKKLADILDRSAARGDYSRLVLSGPPQFLGLLKACLGKGALSHIVATVNKDFSHLRQDEIQERLEEHIHGHRNRQPNHR